MPKKYIFIVLCERDALLTIHDKRKKRWGKGEREKRGLSVQAVSVIIINILLP